MLKAKTFLQVKKVIDYYINDEVILFDIKGL